MKNSLKAGLSLVVALSLVTVTAAPALAIAPRELPAGDTLYAFACDSTMPDVASVDVLTGVLTQIVPSSATPCFTGGAYNQVDGLFYVPDFAAEPRLWTFDPTTSTLTDQGLINCVGLYSLAIDGLGNAYLADDNNDLWTFNLSTRTCDTLIGNLGASFYGMAFNPIDGLLYGASYDDGSFGTISTSTAAFTALPNSAMGAGDNSGFTFDSAGVAWVLDETNQAELFSAPVNDYTASAVNQGQLTYASIGVYSESIAINTTYPAPAPALPNTGTDSAIEIAFAISSTVAVGLGLTLAGLHRRRRA